MPRRASSSDRRADQSIRPAARSLRRPFHDDLPHRWGDGRPPRLARRHHRHRHQGRPRRRSLLRVMPPLATSPPRPWESSSVATLAISSMWASTSDAATSLPHHSAPSSMPSKKTCTGFLPLTRLPSGGPSLWPSNAGPEHRINHQVPEVRPVRDAATSASPAARRTRRVCQVNAVIATTQHTKQPDVAGTKQTLVSLGHDGHG